MKDPTLPNKIAIIGGDLRQLETAKAFAEEGYRVSVYGLDVLGDKPNVKNLTKAEDLKEALYLADCVILPLPFSYDNDKVNAPLSTKELVALCEKELHWKRTTTYTVLKKLCEKGLFQTDNSIVTVLITKDDFQAMQSESFVEDTFNGSLPAFLAAFVSRKKPTETELEEIRKMIDSFGKE